jgi:chromate transporter
MTLAMGVKVGTPLIRDRGGLLLAVAAFVAVHLLHWPLVPVVAVLGPLGVLWAWPRERAAGAPT